jgi:hypothetical protein
MTNTTDTKIIDEAKERFQFCQDWEDQARNNFRADQRMDAGDSENHYQWPDELYQPRHDASKPCLTVNKIHQHVLQVTNDARTNKPSVTIKPVGNGATFKASEILESLVRQIEVHSAAGDAYDTATNNQVVGGIGWWRVTCEYEPNTDSFDQIIAIRRVIDPLSIYMDPSIKMLDGSDAEYAFCFVDIPKRQFDKKYPKFKDQVSSTSPLGEENDQDEAKTGKNVRVCEYFRRIERHDTLHHLDNGMTAKESEVKDADLMDQLKINSANPKKTRDIISYEVEWYLFAGDIIIDRNIWPGSMIPLVRIIGEERVIDGKLDRVGLVRSMLDSQKILNVMNSAAVEAIGLQTKVPWLIASSAVEGNEVQWQQANTKNYAYLVWNDFDDEGNRTNPKPERTEPPTYPQAYQAGITQANADMMASSGQFEASFGQPSNERSGKAINERVRNGNNSTFHFINNLSVGIRYTGRIILELIPKIYDTPDRILKVLGEDGTQSTVALDPGMATAHRNVTSADDESFSAQQVAMVLNPNVGRYQVEADTSASYGTRRMEAFSAISQILMQNESLVPVVGDLLFRSADFPLADEIAERMKNMVPDKALGIGPSQEVTQLQQQLAQQHQVMAQLTHELEQVKSKAMSSELKREIEDYKAQTERMKVVGGIDPDSLRVHVRALMSEIMQQPINGLIAAHMQENSQMIAAAQLPPSQPQPGPGPAQ